MGGVEQYILALSNFLCDQQHEIKFSLITDNTMYPFFKAREIPKYEIFDHLEIYRFGPNLLSVLRGMYFKLLRHESERLERRLTRKLCKEMAKNKKIADSDIFHVHGLWDFQYPTVGCWLSKRFNKPLVVSLHGDMVGSEFLYSMPIESEKSLEILTQASAITTYSQRVFSALEKIGLGEKSHLIPNFVNTKNFQRPQIHDKRQNPGVVMICRLDPFKDPLTAIDAFRLVVKEVPETTLEVVGDGPLYQPIKDRISELGLEKSIFLRGKQFDVRPFLWSNDILITGNAFLTVLEAWSAGLAVIAAKEETTGKIITDGKDGVLVEPRNPQKLANALLHVLRNRDFHDVLVQNGFRTVTSYDIGPVSAKILGLYLSCLQQPDLSRIAKN
jgi:glycosyltransferase involved in cell wall biosynthesis